MEMTTLEKYEKSRNIKPTTFHPPHLKDMKIESTVWKKGMSKTRIVNFDLFDSVHLTETPNHAVGLIGTKIYHLILKG
jgi:hypothetical protein